MRCILHIGTEKTGSTAIQHFLHNNWAQFKAQGTHICRSVGKPNNRSMPSAFMSEDRSDDFLRRMKHKNLKDRRRWRKNLLKDFSKEVAQAKVKSDTFLISSEHFQSRLASLDEIQNLYTFLQPLFDEITVICYLRRQDQLAMSRYSEVLRSGHVLQSLLPVGAKKGKGRLLRYFDFESLLNLWSEAFGERRIEPHVYSKEIMINGDVIHDFIENVGLKLPPPSGTKPGNSNMALSAEAQAVLLGVNKSFSELGCIESERQLRGRLVRYLQAHAPGKSCQPTANDAREFYSLFEASNNAVAKQWFNRDSLFEVDFEGYPESVNRVSAERVAELMAGFMLQEKGSGKP
jgi:hypothetical protein